MFITEKNSVVRVAVILCTISFIGCSKDPSGASQTVAQRNEQSTQPSVRLSGTYSCVQLKLDNGYVEGRGQVKGTGYTAELVAKGDSVQFVLSGQGTVGSYTQLDAGTYALTYTATGTTNGGYFTIKKDIMTDYNAVTFVNRTISGTGSRQITYSFLITLYQYVAGTPQAGQFTPIKASDIFTTTQRIIGIFTFERTVNIIN